MSEWKRKAKQLFVMAMSVILVGNTVNWTALTVKAETLQVQEIVSSGDALNVSGGAVSDETISAGDGELYTGAWSADEEFPENDELFAGYVYKTLYGDFSTFGRSAREQLPSDASKALYDALKTEITKVAEGSLASTIIDVSGAENALFTYNTQTVTNPMEAFNYDFHLVMSALLHDCPYELYWFDKTQMTNFNYFQTTDGNSNVTFQMKSINLCVAGEYQADGYQANAPAVNTTVTSATSNAVTKAKAIVEANKDKTDYEKLVAYKEAICDLVSYNTEAATNNNFSVNSDPWQLIYVFDENTNTNVVCEGYAKAFQYLCDLTTFDEAIACYTVTGQMVGGTGAGGHMWNIVTMEDGNNYLVDITNSDAGSIGQNGELFLAGGDAASRDFNVNYSDGSSGVITYNGYNFTANYRTVFFGYDEETEELWGDGTDSILNLSSTYYEPPKPYIPNWIEVGGVPVVSGGEVLTTSGSGWSYDATTNTLTLSGGTITNNTTYGCGIYIEGDLNIHVTGDTTINAYGVGINSNATLKISLDDGAILNVNSGTDGSQTYGIMTMGSMEISGGTLNVDGDNAIASIGAMKISDSIIKTTYDNQGISTSVGVTVSDSVVYGLDKYYITSTTDSIIVCDNSVLIYGDAVLVENMTLTDAHSMEFETGATLTIPDGVTLDITKIGSVVLGTGSSIDVQDGGTLLCGHPKMDTTNYECDVCGGNFVALVVEDSSTFYESFLDAIAAATDGAVVTLLKNVNLSTETPASIEIKNNIEIVLNHHELDMGGYQLDIRPGYDVSICGGTITGNHLNSTIMNVGTLLLKDVEVSNTNTGNSRPVSSQADLILDGGVINGSLYPSGTLMLVNSPEITDNLQFYLAVSNCDLDIIIGSDLDKTYNMEPLGFGAADNVITCSNGVTLDPEWFENVHASKFVLVHDSENNSMGVRLNIAITTIEQNELTYTGSELTNIFKVTKNADTLAEGTDFTVTVNGSQKAINAGEYTATITGIGRWYAGTVTKTFTISKAEISSVDVAVEEPQAEQMPQSTVEVPANGGYTGTISWEPATEEDKFGYNTVYTATVVLTADSNHKFTENTTAEGFDSVVASADGTTLTLKKTFAATEKIPVGFPVILDKQFTEYYATAEEAMANLPDTIGYYNALLGISGKFDITWSLVGTFDSAFDAENTYKYVIDDPDAANYDFGNDTEGTVIYKNASGRAVTNTASDKEITYDGTTFDVSSLFTIDANAGVATYSVVDTGSADAGVGILNGTELTITKAGKFTIQLSTEANGVYLPSDVTAVLTVNKGVGTGKVTIEDVTYGEALNASISSNTNPDYTVLYTSDDYSSTLAPEDAGAYTVKVTFAETDLYKEAIVTDTFEIKQATPTLTGVKSQNTLYESTLVTDVILVADSMSTVGELKLDSVTELTAGTKEYTYKFTPDDTKNYKTITGKVTLTVLENALVSLTITGNPMKSEYVHGEKFDLTGINVIAEYADGSIKDVTDAVTYDENLVAGQTTVVVSYQGKSAMIPVVVTKIKLDLAIAVWNGTSYNYDGQEHSVELIEIPEGVVVTYSGNKATDAGDYKAKAEFALAEGYSADYYEIVTYPHNTEEFEWRILPKEINANNTVYVLGDSLTYNGKEQTMEVKSVTCDGLEVTYEVVDNKATQAGSSYVLIANANGNFYGYIVIPWSIAQKNISGAEITLDGALTYNGTEQTQKVSSVIVDGIQLNISDFTISDNEATDAGDYLLTIAATANGNFTGNATAKWSIAKKDISSAEITLNNTLTYNGKEQTLDFTVGKADGLDVTYDATGYKATNAGEYELTITANGNFVGGAIKAWSIASKDITGAQIVLGDALIYNGAEQTQSISSVTVDGLTLKTTDYEISGNTAKDAGRYTLTIIGKGNYAGTATETYTVAKADAPVIADITKSYTYSAGSNGATVSVDLASLLPADFAATAYTLATNDAVYVLEEAVSAEGKLTYKVANTGNIGDTTTLTVTAVSKNYDDATIKVVLKITDKFITVLKTGSEVTVTGDKTLTYGQKVGDLAFDTTKAVFVAEGTDTVVEGTLSWVAPETLYNAGQAAPQWKFTPNDTSNYTEVTGTMTIQVEKAVPTVASPAVEVFTYHPEKTLADIILVGNNGNHTVAGNKVDVAGSWNFKEETIVPVVNNNGYVVVFTPVDTANYESVEKTVAMQVTKATPSVEVTPEATVITYGQTLSDATLTGGKAAYETGSTIEVDGSFAWKDTTVAPTVFNSNFTEYEAVFTPADADNYNSVTFKMTVTVNKAPKAPNMPNETMNVAYGVDKVSKASLPQDWSWASEDAATELKVGVVETAVANYTGADAGNYIVETVTVSITRASAPVQKPAITTAPDGVPFIYGNKSLYGWDVINRVFGEAKAGETVHVDMNGTKTVPSYVEETIKGKDITGTFYMNPIYSWTINGQSITSVSDENLGISNMITSIPAATLNKVCGGREYTLVTLEHNGEFGLTAILNAYVGEKHAGKYANLFYYNPAYGSLQFVRADEIGTNGMAHLPYTSASEYVIVIDDTMMSNTYISPKTGDVDMTMYYLYFMALAALAVGSGYVVTKKKRR